MGEPIQAVVKSESGPGTTPGSPTVVGIGASAGGLAALKTLFENVGEDSGLAFVVVVHLLPAHESHLAELLQVGTKVPVQQVVETAEIKANHIYVIPPGYNLSAMDTHLRITPLESNRKDRAPIDHFLRTLASAFDGRAIAVVLTGSGSDGTAGVREVKSKGGLVIVQDPHEAEFDGMPQSAISTGLADLILPVAQIPAAIQKIISTRPKVVVDEEGESQRVQQHELQKIFALLRNRTGRDYSNYKLSTITRRIARRMQLNYVDTLGAYLERLGDHPEEIRALANDLLITVSNFFRDEDVFQALERDVIPKLFEGKSHEDTIRVWSVGCATGEEAYSLAMLLLEASAHKENVAKIQVFATDLHEPSLARAREGYYSKDIENDVSPERLMRFFVRENDGYRIRKEIREMIIFSQHNILSDPPFSRMDLISCRNLMIYLQRKVQDDVIELFHYALKPEGYLVLGTSENIRASELFRAVGKAHKILQKRNVRTRTPHLPVFPWGKLTVGLQPLPPGRPSSPSEITSYRALHAKFLESYSPPSILLSPEDKIVHISDSAGRFLHHPGGEPTQNAMKVVLPELRIELLTALQAARGDRKAIRTKPISLKLNGQPCAVAIHVRPAPDPADEGFVLVSFEEKEEGSADSGGKRAKNARIAKAHEDEKARALEAELDMTRHRLQSVIEQYETSQEEMKASNEELQSANEELRSTLEELETSKEELQSINEELQTVNQENRHKVEELATMSADLQNLLISTDIATLFLDRDLRILRFTPKLSNLFYVRVTDRGRPISDINHSINYDQLVSDARSVMETLVPVEREVRDGAGRWYLMSVRPYRSSDDRIDGVVITFVDVSSRKNAELALVENNKNLASRVAEAEQMAQARIAQILHDDLQQLLFGIQMEASLIRDDVSTKVYGRLDERVAEMHKWIQNAIQVTRRLVLDLSDGLTENQNFHDALIWLTGQVGNLHGLNVKITGESQFPLPKQMQVFLLGAIRELLFNVVKHAGTQQATIDVHKDGTGVSVRVMDEGTGFDKKDAEAKHGQSYGMQHLQRQVQLLDGKIDIDTAPGKGTRVTVWVPTSKF